MKKNLDHHGFALLETLVVIMILTCVITVLFGMIGMRHRMAIGHMQEDEAYYAALSAVRMMADEVVNGNAEWITEDGIERTRTEIQFIPNNPEEDAVSIPIEVWAEGSGDELILVAEAAYGRNRKKIALEMRLESEDNPVWAPVAYRVEE